MKLKKAILGIAALAAFSVASAQEASGFYAGVGIGTLKYEESFANIEFDGDDTSLQVFAGYRVNQWLAVEAAYIDGGSPSDNVLGYQLEADLSALELSLIGSVPLNDVLSLHARAGMLAWDMKVSIDGMEIGKDDGTDLSYGIGAAFRFGPSAEARIEVRSADLEDTDVRVYVLSALWNF